MMKGICRFHLRWIGVILLQLIFTRSDGQVVGTDSLVLNRVQSEQLFLTSNLRLLAERLNISQSRAKVIQAKAWPNPNFSLDQVNLTATPRQLGGTEGIPPLFGNGFGKNQEFTLQLEQLIYTAGKRKKLVAIEQVNVDMAESYLLDVLRNLKLEFRTLFIEQQHDQYVLEVLNRQISSIDRLLVSQQAQEKKGNISKAEVYRLMGTRNQLHSERNEYLQELNRIGSELKTLLALDPMTKVRFLPDQAVPPMDSLLRVLVDTSLSPIEKNPDLMLAQNAMRSNEAMYAYERARRIPDITVRAEYDRGGNFILDLFGVGIAMDLPVFDRNKGNIQAARYGMQQSKHLYDNKALQVRNELYKARQDLLIVSSYHKSLDENYPKDLDQVMEGMTQSFEKRNISLLQFLDFLESYKENKNIYSNAVKNVLLKKEAFNYLSGTDL